MISGIVLAAGESRRMGAQKLLLPYGMTTMIEHICDQVLKSELHEVIVVLGHDPDPIRRKLEGRPLRFAANDGYRSGMLSSVRCGVIAASSEAEAAMVLLGDHPSITSGLIDDLIRDYHERGKGIVVPVYEHKRGHPMLFSMKYRSEILSQFDDTGLRGLLASHFDDVAELASNSADVLSDIDRPEDYQMALEKLRPRID